MTLTCSECGKTQGTEAHYRDRTTPSGYTAACRACRHLRRALWEANLTGERRKRFEQSRKEIAARQRAKISQRRRERARERLELASGIIDKLRQRGLSYRQIGHHTRLSRSAISRYHQRDVKVVHGRVVDTLVDYYVEVLARDRDPRPEGARL